ncbi:sensor histidine kinase [Novosphingobium sp. M1R2S20]|uniref:histidine kinase n=1 Tax=Novosphingobium rhizovicinum TaxID=3228928 RepID=A0ABV3RDN4_9SPHN
MHFDDRLATVLRQPVSGPAMARIQFRQLIDLLAQPVQDGPQGPVYAQAYARLDALANEIPAAERATILREPSTRLAAPGLVAHLADAEPEVASAAMAAADLREEEWLALVPTLPVRARGILRHRRESTPRVEALLERLGIADRALPPAAAAVPPERQGRPELVVVEGGASGRRSKEDKEDSGDGIGAIVQRIEAFRKARATHAEGRSAEAVSPSEPVSAASRAKVLALDFTTDAQGRINWADGPLAPGLIGYNLAVAPDESAAARIQSAMRERQPLTRVEVTLASAPALAGAWRLDALPRFSKPDGRFVGYAGRLRRMVAPSDQRDLSNTQADTMRQVLHELRTPANAIQVAAEIIQQQLYGAAPHEYRALAAAIAGDTAQILAGFDELDRLVKLEAGALTLTEGEADLARIVTETVARLRAWTSPRRSGFALATDFADQNATLIPLTIDHEEAARLVWRLLATLAGSTAPGEMLMLDLQTTAVNAVLTVDVPRSLMERMEGEPGAPQPFEPTRSLSAGMFGPSFTLRLAVAEAAGAGGRLTRLDSRLQLVLPCLTAQVAGHTHA